MSRPSTEATTWLLPAPASVWRKLGIYRRMNARTTMARLHLSQPLCRRIRSSIVMVRKPLGVDPGNGDYRTKIGSYARNSGLGARGSGLGTRDSGLGTRDDELKPADPA